MENKIQQALGHYGLVRAEFAPIIAGNLNKTYKVAQANQSFILQLVNPLFGPQVHQDIEAVTTRLEEKGLQTPRLIRNRAGELYTLLDGEIWRLMTYVDGITFARAADASTCYQAGRLVGRFHRAVADFSYHFQHTRVGVHDTARHRTNLVNALDEHRNHRNYDKIARVGQDILAQLEPMNAHNQPLRIVHGDLKLNNIIFAPSLAAIALVDLDTLGRMCLAFELGDAFRSWCNSATEDDVESVFRIDYLQAGLQGYSEAAADFITPEELDALPRGIETICLELAARFCADALQETYFGWNPQKFPNKSEHHYVRAQSQLALARSYRAQKSDVAKIFSQLFAR